MKVAPRAGWRGNQLMIEKVLAFAEAAPTRQPAPSAQVHTDKQIAARVRREARNAKRLKNSELFRS